MKENIYPDCCCQLDVYASHQETNRTSPLPVGEGVCGTAVGLSPIYQAIVDLRTRLFGQGPGRLLEYPGDRDTSHERMVCFKERAVLEFRA